MKILSILARNCSKIDIELFRGALFHINTKVCLVYFGQDCNIMEFINPLSVADKIVNKAEDLFNKKVSLNDVIKTANNSSNFLTNFKKFFGTGITVTNNGIKYIVKVIKPLRYRKSLLKGTTRKITTQEGGFLKHIFLNH